MPKRCAAQVDTGDHRLHGLINKVFSYVAGSRPEYELAVFTDNKADLAKVMGREHFVHTALTPRQMQEVKPQSAEMEESKARLPQLGLEMTV